MKKSGILNHRLSEVIASMGHGDMLVVADAGLPIPMSVERIDLAVSPGLPGLLEVVTAISVELQVERLVVATELRERNQSLAQALGGIYPEATTAELSHEEFKRLSASARAIVRTGECTPYANVILVSGVTF